jgi:AraC-like DNA-binding protein
MDVLSDVLRTIRLTGAIFFDIEASVPFVGESPSTPEIAAAIMPGVEHIVSFHVVLSGVCWASVVDGPDPPLRMEAGDVVVFPGGASNIMASSPELRGKPDLAIYYRPVDTHLPFTTVSDNEGSERARIICGYLGCDARPYNPLLSALPPLMCVRKPADGSMWITDLLRLALAEGGSKRAGTESILAKLSEAMFVDVIRRHIESLPDEALGWLSGLRDPHIGKALRVIHARPAKPWTLDELAQEVGLSRTVFATRFAQYVDVPPMQYVARWRLQLASRLLGERGVSIAQASAEVGYESEAAFNRAFKKYVGVPPGEWRRRRHAAPLPQSR